MADLDRERSAARVGPHADHDLLLIAARAAGDAVPADRARDDALVADCTECAALATDLRAIANATAELPTPTRPRDFFIGPDQAERLRPRGFARVLGAITGRPFRPFDALRPVAAGLTMIGLAGLLVASIPPPAVPAGGSGAATGSAAQEAPSGGTRSGGDHEAYGTEASSAPAASAAGSAAPSAGPMLSSSGSAKSPGTDIAGGGGGGGTGVNNGTRSAPPRSPLVAAAPLDTARMNAEQDQGTPLTQSPERSAWLVASVALILAGVGLFAASVVRERRRFR